MPTEKGYNGWKNYESWATGLWIDNDEGLYNMVREWAAEAKERVAEGALKWLH